jgi:hypothetical protein
MKWYPRMSMVRFVVPFRFMIVNVSPVTATVPAWTTVLRSS